MDRRQLLTGMLATAFVAAIPVKAMAKLTTSASPLMKRDFHVRYDSIAMTYVKEVLAKQEPALVVRNINGRPLRDHPDDWYRHFLPPDPIRAAYLLEAERRDRAYGNAAWMPAGYDPA